MRDLLDQRRGSGAPGKSSGEPGEVYEPGKVIGWPNEKYGRNKDGT